MLQVDVSGSTIRIPGQRDGVLAEIRDVTEQVRAEEALRASEEQVRTVFETVRSGLVVIGPDGIPILSNGAAAELLGYSREQLQQVPVASLVAPESRAMVSRNLAARLRGEPASEQYQIQMLRADGKVIDVDVRATPFSLGGEVLGSLAELRDVTEELALRRRAAEAAEERQHLVQQLLNAQEVERRQVAYDIHDGPAQSLAGAAMFLEAYRAERQQRESGTAEQHLELVATYVDEALQETRRIMSELRPALLDDLGLVEALKSSIETLTRRAGAEFEFDADASGLTLDAPTEIVLFRVAQEAVGNALQHSGTDRVKVSLHSGASEAVMTVQDWGSGIDPTAAAVAREEGNHLGLVGMRERAELLGGSFAIETAPGEGTTITVRVPATVSAGATGERA